MSIAAIDVQGGPRTAQGSAETLDREVLAMVLDCAFAPGAPLSIRTRSEPPLSLDAKTIGSKRRPDGSFDVRARLVNVSRELRAQLQRLAAHPPSSDSE